MCGTPGSEVDCLPLASWGYPRMKGRAKTQIVIGLLAWLAAAVAHAQGPGQGPVPVRVTEVARSEVRRAVTLPGTVESLTEGAIAAEVEGLVTSIEAREGTTVRAGRTVVRLSRTNLELRKRALEGQLREARARLDLAERNLERAEDLYDDGVISQGEYDDAVSESSAWQGRIDQLSADLQRVEVDLERCDIRAPYDGVVVAERTEVGQWIDVGDPVAEMLALDRLEVRIEVPERYFAELVRGTTASVTFESLPGRQVDGVVSAIVPRADELARTFPVKVSIRGKDIAVGMLARVSLPLGERYPALLVPKDAVVSRGPMRFVYRVDGEDAVESVGVQPGMGVGAWVIVEGPLEAGQRVVTRGNERLQPGQKVIPAPQEYERP